MSGFFKKNKKKVPPPKKVADVVPEAVEEEAIYDDGEGEGEQEIYALPDDEVPPVPKKLSSPTPEAQEETYEEPTCMSSSDISEESGSDGRPPLPLPPRPGKEEKKQKGKSYGVELDTLKDAVVNLKRRQPGENGAPPISPKPVVSPKPAPPTVKERKNPPLPESPTPSPSNGTEVFTFPVDDEDTYTDAASLRLSMHPWYHGDISREEGQKRVQCIGKDGAFLLRTSKKDPSQPYTLVLLYKSRVNNLKVRKRSDGQFALGEEKQNEIAFETEDDIISYHKKNAVTLTGSNPGETTLSECPDGKKSS